MSPFPSLQARPRLVFHDRGLFPACRPLGQQRWIPLHISTPARLRDSEFIRGGWRVLEFSADGPTIVQAPDGFMLEIAEREPEAA